MLPTELNPSNSSDWAAFSLCCPFITVAITSILFAFQLKKWTDLVEVGFRQRHQILFCYVILVAMCSLIAQFFLNLSPLEATAFTAFAGLAIGAVIIDFYTGYLPNTFTYLLILLGLITNLFGQMDSSFQYFINPIPALWGVVIGYASIFLANRIHIVFTGKDGIGMGDARLLAGVGAWYGGPPLFVILGIAALFSLFVPIYKQYIKKESAKMTPFGPYLGMAAVPYIFFIQFSELGVIHGIL